MASSQTSYTCMLCGFPSNSLTDPLCSQCFVAESSKTPPTDYRRCLTCNKGFIHTALFGTLTNCPSCHALPACTICGNPTPAGNATLGLTKVVCKPCWGKQKQAKHASQYSSSSSSSSSSSGLGPTPKKPQSNKPSWGSNFSFDYEDLMADKKVRPQIFWDPSSKKYILKAGYSQAFLQDFKTYTDHPPTFNGGNRTWSFDERDIAIVLQTVEQHFPATSYGKCDFIPKPPERRQVINGKTTPAGAAALRMFEVAGIEAAKQVYSMLIKKYHPDLNPNQSQEDRDKATEITTNWRALKQHMNWS